MEPSFQSDASFEALFSEVQAALTGKGSVKSLQSVLSMHRLHFLRCQRSNLLRRPLIKESTLNVYRPHLDATQVRQLNDRLGVQNEAYCQALLLEATTQSLNFGYPPEELAEYIHYRPRVFLLNSLREILRARVDETQPYDLRTLLTQFVAQLVAPGAEQGAEGLTQVLLSLLQSYNSISAHKNRSTRGDDQQQQMQLSKHMSPHALKEAKLVAECLFYLFYCDPGSQMSQIVNKQNVFTTIVNMIDSFFTTEEVPLHSVNTILVFTAYCIFMMLGSERKTFQDEEVLSSAFLQRCDNALINMKNKEAQQALGLPFSVLVRRRGPSVSSIAADMSAAAFVRYCVEGDAFSVMASVLDRTSYATDDNFLHFGTVVDRVLSGMILYFFPEITDLKRSEEEQLAYEKERLQRAANVRLQTSATAIEVAEERPKRFTQFMRLMQVAYRKQPTLSEKYWDFRGEKDVDNKRLHYFLGVAGRDGWQVRTPAGFCAYLDMLSSFAGGADNNAYYGYMFVKTGLNEFIRLQHFFDVLTSYTAEMAKGSKIDRLQEETTMSILGFLQSILSGSEEVRRLLAESRERPLDVLKSLLMSNFKPRVKAAVLDTLRAFADSPALAPTVWMVLEVSGIMSASGITVELLDESNYQSFSETIAFLQLLERLLSVLDLAALQESAKQFRPDGSLLGPYMNFVIEEVFLKNESRSFKDLSEKWRIFSLSLNCFLLVLQRFDAVDFRPNVELRGNALGEHSGRSNKPDVTNAKTVLSIATNPFYELMTRFLDGYLFDRVLAVMRMGVTNSALEETRFSRPWGRVMEDACLAALCIVEEVASKEDYYEDLLDVLDDWEQRKLDATINPYAALFSSRASGAMEPEHLDRSFASSSFSQGYLGGSYNESFAYSGNYGRNDRKIPEPLLTLEGRSVRPAPVRDYMLHQKGASLIAICNYVDYAMNLEVPLHAVKILLIMQPQIPSLVSTLLQSGQLPYIRLGFMNRLEDVHPNVAVREQILHLLLASVRSPRPNLAQVLMGYAPFDMDEEPAALTAMNAAYLRAQQQQLLQKQQQQNPQMSFNGNNNNTINANSSALAPLSAAAIEAMAAPETRRSDASNVWDENRGYCLGLVLDLLRNPQINVSSPELAMLCYRLIHTLCATKYTSARMLAYLRRSSHAFLLQHLSRLTSQVMLDDPISRVNQLDQLSWLLQTVALEIHITASSGREFLSQGLLHELFTIPSAEATKDDSLMITESDLLNRSRAAMDASRKPHNRMKMVELLDVLDAFLLPGYTPLKPADLRVFRGIDIDACRSVNAKGRKVIDLRFLHRVLLDFQTKLHEEGPRFVANAETTAAEAEELRVIMTDALKQNQFTEALLAKLHLFDSWKRVLEVAVIECFNSLGVADVEPYLFELIEVLLIKMTHPANTHLPLLESMADTCLVLITKLREQISYTSEGDEDNTDSQRFSRTPLERLHAILVGALGCIVDKTPSSASLRGTLYAFLVNYFQFAKHVRWAPLDGEGSEMLHGRNGLALRAEGERLLERLAGDCQYGTDSWKSVALALLDVLIARPDPETSQELLKILARRGYIHFFCNLQRFEEPLRACIRDPNHQLNALFVWESQLSFLIRVSESPGGTLLLSEAGLLGSLVDLKFIDSRPSVTLSSDPAQAGSTGWFPSLTERYEQAMYPLGALISSLATSSHEPNAEVVRHVFEFLSAHTQAVTDILQDNTSNPPVSSLRLLRVWTSVFYAVAPFLHRPNLSSQIQRYALHFRELLLNLAHKYAAFPEVGSRVQEEAVLSAMALGNNISEGDRGAEVLRLRQALIGYFRRSMIGEGEKSLVFSPHLKEDCSRPPSKHGASLSLLAFYLFHSYQCLSQLAQVRASVDAQLQRAMRSEMLPGEISKLVESSGLSEVQAKQLPVKRRIAISYLTRQMKSVDESRMAHQFIIENTLLIMLKHLSVYCKSSDSVKQKLLRASSTSDRVGLLALVNRLSTSSDDPVVFDLIRRIRAVLERT